jgi:hypothetical protein
LLIVEFTLRHGRVEGDRHVIDRNESRRLLLRVHTPTAFGLRAHQIIEALTEGLRLARRIMDKGGFTVVEGNDTVITAYNVDVPMRGYATVAARNTVQRRNSHGARHV